jgi:hypothetical protein
MSLVQPSSCDEIQNQRRDGYRFSWGVLRDGNIIYIYTGRRNGKENTLAGISPLQNPDQGKNTSCMQAYQSRSDNQLGNQQ